MESDRRHVAARRFMAHEAPTLKKRLEPSCLSGLLLLYWEEEGAEGHTGHSGGSVAARCRCWWSSLGQGQT